jgi:hypothetical protein
MSGHGRPFWIAVVAGVAIMAYGINGYFERVPDLTRRVDLARWILGVNLVHDFVLAPMVLLVGLGVAHVVPKRLREPVRVGLVASGVVLLVAWRPLQHSAASKHNATVQPLDYRTATLTVLVCVWLLVGAWFAIAAYSSASPRRRRRNSLRASRAAGSAVSSDSTTS